MSNGCACTQNDERFQEILGQYQGQDGALIPVLQKAQDVYGYLPEATIRRIAGYFGKPVSEVYGVATFYSQFHLAPRGENIVRVCMGTACHVRGGQKILDKICETLGIQPGETTGDRKYTLESVACIGACGLSPVIMVDEDTHGRLTQDRIPEILGQCG